MQKSYLFPITTIFLTIIIIPTIAMELSSNNLEKPKLMVKLRLKEIGQNSIEFSNDCGYSERDKNACKLLGIPWEENNNRYWVTKATVDNLETQQKISWLDECPVNLHQTSIPHYFNENIDQCKVLFPSSLPASFVAQLKQKNITPKNDLSTEITLKLGYIKEKKMKNSYFYTFYFFTGFTAAGIIAFIVYLYKNKQLDSQPSHITDFINNLISNKNS